MIKGKCDIIICVWNQKKLTEDCIESIIKNTRYPYRLILIDNNSDEETKSYLESLKNDSRLEVLVIRNEENLGNTKAVNQGLKASTAEYVCNLDNDTYMTEGWLTELVAVAEKDSKIGIVSPSFPKKIPSGVDIIEYLNQFATEIVERRGIYQQMITVDCYCALFKRTMIDKVGLWDEVFNPGYFDDTDYCRRTINAGFEVVRARGACVHHIEHGSFRKNKRKEELFERNKKIYFDRYGQPKRVLYIVDHYDQKRYEIIDQQAHKEARNMDLVWFLTKKSIPKFELKLPGNMRQYFYTSPFFSLKAVFRVITRQKKRFDRIYVFNRNIKKVLDWIKIIHRSKVELI